MLPGSFEIHLVRQYLVNLVLCGTLFLPAKLFQYYCWYHGSLYCYAISNQIIDNAGEACPANTYTNGPFY